MTIRIKNMKKDPREKSLYEEEKDLLQEAVYILVFDRICLAEEGGNRVYENNRYLRE